VVLIDTKLDNGAAAEAGAKWDEFIGSDNRLGGKIAAQAMVEALRGKGHRVLLLKGSYVHHSAIDRAEGFIEGAAGKLNIVERDGEWSRQRATELTLGVMTREPVDGIFASNDDMALGSVAALKSLGVSGADAPIIIGFDATSSGVEAINRDEMYASVKQDTHGMGVAGVSLAQALSYGRDVPKDTLIPVVLYRKPPLSPVSMEKGRFSTWAKSG
jgi:ribose transport system substrate-binding protein